MACRRLAGPCSCTAVPGHLARAGRAHPGRDGFAPAAKRTNATPRALTGGAAGVRGAPRSVSLRGRGGRARGCARALCCPLVRLACVRGGARLGEQRVQATWAREGRRCAKWGGGAGHVEFGRRLHTASSRAGAGGSAPPHAPRRPPVELAGVPCSGAQGVGEGGCRGGNSDKRVTRCASTSAGLASAAGGGRVGSRGAADTHPPLPLRALGGAWYTPFQAAWYTWAANGACCVLACARVSNQDVLNRAAASRFGPLFIELRLPGVLISSQRWWRRAMAASSSRGRAVALLAAAMLALLPTARCHT